MNAMETLLLFCFTGVSIASDMNQRESNGYRSLNKELFAMLTNSLVGASMVGVTVNSCLSVAVSPKLQVCGDVDERDKKVVFVAGGFTEILTNPLCKGILAGWLVGFVRCC
jgi:hypothetical protein